MVVVWEIGNGQLTIDNCGVGIAHDYDTFPAGMVGGGTPPLRIGYETGHCRRSGVQSATGRSPALSAEEKESENDYRRVGANCPRAHARW